MEASRDRAKMTARLTILRLRDESDAAAVFRMIVGMEAKASELFRARIASHFEKSLKFLGASTDRRHPGWKGRFTRTYFR